MKQLADDGKLIEAGWVGLRLAVGLANAPPDQHLFSSIMSILEPGEEPTDADLRRMDLISTELEQWHAKLKARVETKPRPVAQPLGDAPIEQQYREQMNTLARYLELRPQHVGDALIEWLATTRKVKVG
jgi:hypothetical protein